MNLPALEHRLDSLERDLRRRGIGPTPPVIDLDPERARELLRGATDAELDRLDQAEYEGDLLERARVLVALERRVAGQDVDAEAIGQSSALATVIAEERQRRGTTVAEAFASTAAVLEWLHLEELNQLMAAVRVGIDLGDGRTQLVGAGARIGDRLLERARRRRALGVVRPGVAAHRMQRGTCRVGVETCSCAAKALDLASWQELGLPGLRAVARHHHVVVRAPRASGAARRRRARARRPAALPVPAAVPNVEEVFTEPHLLDDYLLDTPPDADVVHLAAVEEPLAGEETTQRAARAPDSSPRRRRGGMYVAREPLSDREVESLNTRLGIGTGWSRR